MRGNHSDTVAGLPDLPVRQALPELLGVLRTGRRAILEAPPGAGKTTLVPPALLAEEWLAGGKILLLEPRRVAARNAAYRIAELLKEEPGERVGYRMRGESRVGPRTVVEVLTEGVLTAMLRGDPSLGGVAAVIFDEFHERSLHADLGLAFSLQSADLFRPDLRIVVMSATLDTAEVVTLLGDAPVVRSEGKIYPVDTRYLGRDPNRRIEEEAAGAVRRALGETEGDILLFLPGAGEIERTGRLLSDLRREGALELHPLHGSLSRTAQDRALRPSPSGARKVVLSSAIAETSLTIEGVRVVVDAGLSRVPRFDPSTGLSRLATIPVSRASADQRRGRGGRLGPGVCYRLWSEAENHALRPSGTPEILESDLLPLALDLLAWGADPGELQWLDPPPPGPYAAALELGQVLGLVDPSGGLTPAGRISLEIPLHPRLCRMIVAAVGSRENLSRAVTLAALLEEGDPLRGEGGRRDPDIYRRLDLIDRYRRRADIPSDVDRAALGRIDREIRRLERLATDVGRGKPVVGAKSERRSLSVGELLAIAYPDRIAMRRESGGSRYLLSSGRAVRLPEGAPPSGPFLVAPAIAGSGREGYIALAAPVELDEVERVGEGRIREEMRLDWNTDSGRVEIRSDRLLDSITLSSRPVQNPDDDLIVKGTIEGVRRAGLQVLPWSRRAEDLRNRMAFLHYCQRDSDEGSAAGSTVEVPGAWPDVSDKALLERLDEWLAPLLMKGKGRNRLAGVDMVDALRGLLGWKELAEIDRLAPERIVVPSGARLRIDYSRPEEPVLPVRLQDMFGGKKTPEIAAGQVPLTLHLLSPANRPVQITRDLEGFWTGSYIEVRKEMKGRYPKHNWPENPGE